MNGDSIFFENHMLSREIEFLVTNIWQCADIATYMSVCAGTAEVNRHDRFLKKFEIFFQENSDIVYFASFKYFSNKASDFIFIFRENYEFVVCEKNINF